MMSTYDKEYIETREIKRGNKQVIEPFQSLINWFANYYGIRPLNICYEFLKHNQKPRLEIIFENRDIVGNYYNDKEKDSRLEQVFSNLITDRRKYKSDNLFVISSSFASIARMEANNKISKEEIDNLKKQLNLKELWHIQKSDSSAIFFFYTKEQEQILSKSDDIVDKIRERYFELIKKYDEFGYLKKEKFGIRFDNKEKFDEIYQSSWQYYFKDH